jgi:glycosyltransferase involved in cell wall biosynthesis
MPKVSICIPTYKRPDLLQISVNSCLAQTFQDFEIVISDDSPDTRTAELIPGLSANQPIRYVHNVPGLGQAKNVNQLFHLAQGEFLVLLHDDDFLMPDALSELIAPLRDNPSVVASLGKQYLASHDGSILDLESRVLNERYAKTDDRANRIQRSEWSVLAAQFPPDGYMVRTAAARDTLYRDDADVGEACDADFSFRLSKLGDFFLVGKHVSAYRITQESVSSRGLRILLGQLYFIVQGFPASPDLKSLQKARLQQLAPVAVNGCLLTSARAKALGILFGKNYPWKQQFVKGVVQLGLAFAPRSATRMVIERNTPRRRAAQARWLSSVS